MTVALYLCMHTLIFSGLTWTHAHKKTSTRANAQWSHTALSIIPWPHWDIWRTLSPSHARCYSNSLSLSLSLSLAGHFLITPSHTHTQTHAQGQGWTRKVRWVRLQPTNRSGGKGKVAGGGQRLPQVSGFTPAPPCRTRFFFFFYCHWFLIKTALCFPLNLLPFLARNLVWGVWSRFRLSGRSMVDVWCSRNLLLNVTDLNRQGGVEEDGGEEG